jgi:putative photosynthetic complex assembly protein 2
LVVPSLVVPCLTAIVVWWFSTGAILCLNRLPRWTFRWSFLGATGLLAASLYGLSWSAAQTSVSAAYVAFLSSIGVWAWLELSFLMGFITGPRPLGSPASISDARRFGFAVQALLYHELAVLAAGGMVALLTLGEPNRFGQWTFLAVWAMKLSAKLNLHLGARNLGEHLLPPHLAYLQTYFTRRPMNRLFPVSVAAAVWVALQFGLRASGADVSSFEATGSALVATMLMLAVFEHALLFVPLPPGALWAFGFAPRPAAHRPRDPAVAWAEPLPVPEPVSRSQS